MGTWNQPVMFPYQPSFLERMGPSIVGLLGQMALMKMANKFQAEQADVAAKRAEAAAKLGFGEKAYLAGAEEITEKPTMGAIGATAQDIGISRGPYGVPRRWPKKPEVPEGVTLIPAGRGKWTAIQGKLPAADIQMYNLWKQENPAGTVKQFMTLSESGKPGSLAKKIANLRKAYPGLDDQNIRRLAAGTIKVIKDPVTDEWIVTDLGTRERLPLQTRGEQPGVPSRAAPPDTTLYELADLVSGPVSAGLAAASVPAGWVGLPIAERTVRARQYVQSAQNELVRSLSINPRFPVGEIKRLREEINISPKILDNPDMLRQRMSAVDKYLRWRLDKEITASENTKLPKSVRQGALSAANDIGSFLSLLGVPGEADTITPEDRELINKWRNK